MAFIYVFILFKLSKINRKIVYFWVFRIICKRWQKWLKRQIFNDIVDDCFMHFFIHNFCIQLDVRFDYDIAVIKVVGKENPCKQNLIWPACWPSRGQLHGRIEQSTCSEQTLGEVPGHIFLYIDRVQVGYIERSIFIDLSWVSPNAG